MISLVGHLMSIPMEVVFSHPSPPHCGHQASSASRLFRVPTERLKLQCLMLHVLPAGERATLSCASSDSGPLDSNALHEQSPDQVAEPRNECGRILARRSLLAISLSTAVAWPSSSAWAVKVENRAPFGNFLLRSFGIGDPDIYYPRFFEGTWNCFSTLIAVETPQGESKIDVRSVESSRKRLGYTVGGSKQTTYKARFVPYNGFVVCDRLFTTVSLVESIIGKGKIEHGVWSPQQPNHLELILKGGVKVENTVTKRSAGMFSPFEFESAEFSKQVLDNFTVKDGPPTVKASQNLTRYQWDSTAEEVSKIEAIQKVSMYAVPKEGQDFEGMEMFNVTSPVTIYKYRLTFERL